MANSSQAKHQSPLPGFLRPWLLIALSEDAGEAVAVEHTVRVRRTA